MPTRLEFVRALTFLSDAADVEKLVERHRLAERDRERDLIETHIRMAIDRTTSTAQLPDRIEREELPGDILREIGRRKKQLEERAQRG